MTKVTSPFLIVVAALFTAAALHFSEATPPAIDLAAPPQVTKVTLDNVEEVLASSEGGTLVLNFWAPWCPPCKAMTPVLNELASATPAVRFARVDVQSQNELASEYGVTSIPVTYVIRDQKIVKKFNGYVPKEELTSAVLTR